MTLLALALRALRAGTTYGVTIRRGTCSGATWAPSPIDPDLQSLCIVDLVAGPSTLVAVGSDCDGHAAVAVSQDNGLTWEPALGSTLGGATQLDVVVSNPAGFVAYGQTASGGIGVWTSPDGLAWRAAGAVAPLPGWDRSWVSDAVPFGPGAVLVGGSVAAADHLRSDVLVSGDGVTLRWAPWAPQMAEPTMAAAVAWNGRLYVVGAGGAFFLDPAVPILWTAELRATP